MADSILSATYFHIEDAAYAFVESKVWPRGPIFNRRLELSPPAMASRFGRLIPIR